MLEHQVSGGPRWWRSRLPLRVKGGCGRQVGGTAGPPPAPEIAVRFGTCASAARRSCFRLRFRGYGRRQRAMIGTSSPAKRRMSRRTLPICSPIWRSIRLDRSPISSAPRAQSWWELGRRRSRRRPGSIAPDRCQLAKGVCGAILFCAMMASARARFSSRRWLVKTRK